MWFMNCLEFKIFFSSYVCTSYVFNSGLLFSSYICRDGTTRRWMCHGFLACREPGERLSHAVGCAFAACLERKQRRDKDTIIAAELTKSHTNKILANGTKHERYFYNTYVKSV